MKRTKIMAGAIALSLIVGSYPATVFASETQESYAEETAETKESQDEKKEEQKSEKTVAEKPAEKKTEETVSVKPSVEKKETEETTAKETSAETKETEESVAKESAEETKETESKETETTAAKETETTATKETEAKKEVVDSKAGINSWDELKKAFANASADGKVTTIKIGSNIDTKEMLAVKKGMTIVLDLNGHTLNRRLLKADADGHVFIVNNGGHFTIEDSSKNQTGTVTGGYANNGGAVNNKGTLNIRGGRFQGNSAVLRGGAIYNHTGSVLCIEGGVFTNNSCTGDASARGGAIYNDGSLSIQAGKITANSGTDCGGVFNDKNGVAVIGGVTAKSVIISNNKSVLHGGGGINNYGILSLQNCEITGNEAKTDGAGIWDNGTLEVEGEVIVKNNKKDNFFLKNGKVISLSDKLSKTSEIHVTVEGSVKHVVENWNMYNRVGEANSVFKFTKGMVLDAKGENLQATYINRTWNGSKVVVNKAERTPEGAEIRRSLSTTLSSGWYFIDKEVKIGERVRVPAGQNVNIILADGANVVLPKGINVSGTLHIYGQGKDTGILSASADCDNAAIGGDNNFQHGIIHIHGGKIIAKGNDNGAGIGTGNKAGTGTDWNSAIYIYGGNVKANGGSEAAAIGGGDCSANGKIFIYGGTVEAKGGSYAAGIGTGDEAKDLKKYMDKHPIHIYGGHVIASSPLEGAGIGGGNECGGGVVHIHGGRVEATGSDRGAAIGGGDEGEANCVIIDGGEVFATGQHMSAAIGCGTQTDGIGNITINGGTVFAEGGFYGAGIGGSCKSRIKSGKITITGGTIEATAGTGIRAKGEKYAEGAGIGGGMGSDVNCEITITGGNVTAIGGNDGSGAGIGAGSHNYSGGEFSGKITISGGTVKAYGTGMTTDLHKASAGIGSGSDGNMSGVITITGGTVYASSVRGAAAIGGGLKGRCTGSVNIQGGTLHLRTDDNTARHVAPSHIIGYGGNSNTDGKLNLSDDMMVYETGAAKKYAKASERVSFCHASHNNIEVVIAACDHNDCTYEITRETHTKVCSHCQHKFASDEHKFTNDTCDVCGHISEAFTITYLAGEGTGKMESEKYRPGMKTALRESRFTAPEGKVFKGWSVKIGDAEPVVMESKAEVEFTADITATAIFEYPDGIGAVLTGNTISLDGDIAANFFMEVAPEIAASKTAYMQFTLPNGKTTKTYFKDVSYRYTDGSRICFMFKCRVSSKEMADDIKAQVIDGDRQGTVYTFNVKDYAEYILKHQEVSEYREAAPLVKAILNYGAASQKYFNYHTNNLANSGMSESDRKIKMITAKDLDYGLKNASYGLEPEKVSLELESKTIMRLKFNPEAVKGATFKMGDKVLRTELSGGYLIVFVEDIKAADLFKSYLVTVDFGNKQYGVRYSPMDFFRHAIENENCKTETKELVSAMYHYAELTKAYNDKQLVC